jgi:hypothetical protein
LSQAKGKWKGEPVKGEPGMSKQKTIWENKGGLE